MNPEIRHFTIPAAVIGWQFRVFDKGASMIWGSLQRHVDIGFRESSNPQLAKEELITQQRPLVEECPCDSRGHMAFGARAVYL